jgi:hypothetical protein
MRGNRDGRGQRGTGSGGGYTRGLNPYGDPDGFDDSTPGEDPPAKVEGPVNRYAVRNERCGGRTGAWVIVEETADEDENP